MLLYPSIGRSILTVLPIQCRGCRSVPNLGNTNGYLSSRGGDQEQLGDLCPTGTYPGKQGRSPPPARSSVAPAALLAVDHVPGFPAVLGTSSRLRVLGSVLLGSLRYRPASHFSTCLDAPLLSPHTDLYHRIDLCLQGEVEACSPPAQVKRSRRSVRAHVWPCDYLQGSCVKRSVGREINTAKKQSPQAFCLVSLICPVECI
jgi:hypothetical protein